MPSVNMDSFEFPFHVGAVIKGALLALAISLLLSVCVGLIYHLSVISEKTLPLFTSLILAIGVFCGSFKTGKQTGNKGLYNGIAVGLLFFVAVWIVAALFFPGTAAISSLYKLLIILPCASLGGIVGVGLAT